MNIKKIIKEEIERQILSDLEDSESRDDLFNNLKQLGIPYKLLNLNNNEVLVFDNYIIDDFDFIDIESKENWLINLYNVSDYAGFVDEEMSKRFWENPETLYHATQDENVQSILEKGLLTKNKSRGISNTSIGSAIFTVDNYDLLWDGHYGNNIFEINTSLMKQDGYTPFITKEPDVEEKIQIESLANLIGLKDYEHYIDSGSGMWENTWIIHESIPPKYLTLMD